MCARMAYEALMEFAHFLQTAAETAHYLRHVHFVNIDHETTQAMMRVMSALYQQRLWLPAAQNDEPLHDSRRQIHSRSVDTSTDGGTSTSTDSGTGTGVGTCTGTDSGTSTDTDVGIDIGTNDGTNDGTSAATGTNIGTDVGTDDVTGTSTHDGTSAGTNTDVGIDSDTCTDRSTDDGTSAGTGTNVDINVGTHNVTGIGTNDGTSTDTGTGVGSVTDVGTDDGTYPGTDADGTVSQLEVPQAQQSESEAVSDTTDHHQAKDSGSMSPVDHFDEPVPVNVSDVDDNLNVVGNGEIASSSSSSSVEISQQNYSSPTVDDSSRDVQVNASNTARDWHPPSSSPPPPPSPPAATAAMTAAACRVSGTDSERMCDLCTVQRPRSADGRLGCGHWACQRCLDARCNGRESWVMVARNGGEDSDVDGTTGAGDTDDDSAATSASVKQEEASAESLPRRECEGESSTQKQDTASTKPERSRVLTEDKRDVIGSDGDSSVTEDSVAAAATDAVNDAVSHTSADLKEGKDTARPRRSRALKRNEQETATDSGQNSETEDDIGEASDTAGTAGGASAGLKEARDSAKPQLSRALNKDTTAGNDVKHSQTEKNASGATDNASDAVNTDLNESESYTQKQSEACAEPRRSRALKKDTTAGNDEENSETEKNASGATDIASGAVITDLNEGESYSQKQSEAYAEPRRSRALKKDTTAGNDEENSPTKDNASGHVTNATSGLNEVESFTEKQREACAKPERSRALKKDEQTVAENDGEK